MDYGLRLVGKIGAANIILAIPKPNKSLHLTAIPLRFIAAGELGR